jgi:hypothetical protein
MLRSWHQPSRQARSAFGRFLPVSIGWFRPEADLAYVTIRTLRECVQPGENRSFIVTSENWVRGIAPFADQ